ncbi:hypothetical protein OQA88_6990 [Cercophora sp. LCS_1]
MDWQMHYEPLPRDKPTIRLLRLLSADVPTEPIHCELQVVTFGGSGIEQCPQYKAISYAWQDSSLPDDDEYSPLKAPIPVICNGNVITIPPNLCYLLVRLRAQASRQELTLWADSICINQQDLQERGEQVAMMGDIFRCSEEVIIWLGETNHAVGAHWTWVGDRRDQPLIEMYQGSFEKLKPLQGAAQEDRGDDLGAFCLLSRLCQVDSASDIAFYESRKASDEQFAWSQRVKRSLWRMEGRSWWRRTWIVQECLLPKKAVLMYGALSAPWEMLAGAAKVHMSNRAWVDISRATTDPLDRLSSLILRIEAPRTLMTARGHLQPLQALQQFHIQRATDPRDKVFGILGLLAQPLLKPDYEMTNLEVFYLTALRIISLTGRLNILKGSRSSTVSGLPTWCTDWGTEQDEAEWQRIKCLNLYNASGGVSGPIHLHKAGNVRVSEVPGTSVDEVRHVLHLPAPADGDGRWRAAYSQWVEELKPIGLSKQLWLSLCGGLLSVDGGREPNEGGFRRATPADKRFFSGWIFDDTAKIHRKTRVFGLFDSMENIEPDQNQRVSRESEFFDAMQAMTARREIFVTQFGRIGVGPLGTKAQDKVVVLAGTSVPFLLRDFGIISCARSTVQKNFPPQKGSVLNPGPACEKEHFCFKVLGDVYIPGLMDGEALKSRQL